MDTFGDSPAPIRQWHWQNAREHFASKHQVANPGSEVALLERGSRGKDGNGGRRSSRRAQRIWLVWISLSLAAIFGCATPVRAGQFEDAELAAALPEAPQPQQPVTPESKPARPCPATNGAKPAGASGTNNPDSAVHSETPAEPANPQTKTGPGNEPVSSQPQEPCKPAEPPIPMINWFSRFLNGPQVKPLTPKEKAKLATRNVLDPFNAITILGSSAIAVGADSHSPYGPGMTGFARSVGVSYTQDITGEFFGTFLIPSLAHQDPHYHRMPNASIPRRIGHAIAQVVWTQGDNGKGMLNYANLAGFAIDDEISNLYVPGRETNLAASAARYGIGFAIAPTDNFVTEFLPDVARRIHVRVVLVQRIINQVARTESAGSQ